MLDKYQVSFFFWPRGIHWFSIGFIRQSELFATDSRLSVLLAEARPMGFRYVYKVIRFTVFLLSRGIVAHGATHAALMGKACFPLVL